ncbi:MAG: GNAT family N-acetyltransferase [Rubricoccaceae bacterium]|nr:GNAT family N-acetyltransferase [Rubricoccaceae bacterium]
MPADDPRRDPDAPDPFGDRLPTLETERLRLRHPRLDDAEAVLTVFGDPEAMRYWSHPPLGDLAAARRYIRGIHDGFAARRLFQWAITEAGEDRLIGTVTLYAWDPENRRVEVGFMLDRAHWGKGYAGEAVRAALAFGFDRMGLHRVEADVHPDNAGSLRLLERLGFRREGYLPDRWWVGGEPSDSVLLGLLRDAFPAAPPREPAGSVLPTPSDPFPAATPYAAGLPPIRTPRLLLRALTAAEDPGILALFSDETALETWTHPPFTSLDDARTYRAMLETAFVRRAAFTWGVFEGEGEGPPVGVGILTRWSANNRRVDLGYYLGSAHWGRGYATEAARALVGWAFERLGVHRIEAEVVPGNDASVRVLERVGFRHEARLVERLWDEKGGPYDSLLFRILRPEFEVG